MLSVVSVSQKNVVVCKGDYIAAGIRICFRYDLYTSSDGIHKFKLIQNASDYLNPADLLTD